MIKKRGISLIGIIVAFAVAIVLGAILLFLITNVANSNKAVINNIGKNAEEKTNQLSQIS
jgi:competence protein ComGC